MAAAILIFAVLSAVLFVYLFCFIRFEIRVHRYCRDMGQEYLPAWFRIWVRLACGTSGACRNEAHTSIRGRHRNG